jgi:hypothetical protein
MTPDPEPVQRLKDLLDGIGAARGERERTDDPERRPRVRVSPQASRPASTSPRKAGRLPSGTTGLRALAVRSRRLLRQLPSLLVWLIALAAPARRRAAPLANRAVAAVMGIAVASLAWLIALAAPARRRAAPLANPAVAAVMGIAVARRAPPLKILMLALATLAAGGLGLMVAYAVTPDAPDEQTLVTNGETYQIATVTGPGGTTTVAVTKTKEGKTKFTPVRLTRTVDGPGDTEKVFVDVVGEPVVLRDTDTRLMTQIAMQMATQTQIATQTQGVTRFQPATQTQVVTQRVTETQIVTQPVTETLVVTQSKGKPKTDTVVVTETVTVTETKEITVTETGAPPP